jgi:hypothetical protein
VREGGIIHRFNAAATMSASRLSEHVATTRLLGLCVTNQTAPASDRAPVTR